MASARPSFNRTNSRVRFQMPNEAEDTSEGFESEAVGLQGNNPFRDEEHPSSYNTARSNALVSSSLYYPENPSPAHLPSQRSKAEYYVHPTVPAVDVEQVFPGGSSGFWTTSHVPANSQSRLLASHPWHAQVSAPVSWSKVDYRTSQPSETLQIPSSASGTPLLHRSVTEERVRAAPAHEAVALVNKMESNVADEAPANITSQHRDSVPVDGILSHLLKSSRGDAQHASGAGVNGSTTLAGPDYHSRVDEGYSPHRSSKLQSRCSSVATSFNGWELDEDDPRLQQLTEKESMDDVEAIGSGSSYSEAKSTRSDSDLPSRKPHSIIRRKRTEKDADQQDEKLTGRDADLSIAVADLIQRQTFILKLAKALMVFGAPSHRLEAQLNATARALSVNAQFIHLPAIVIASFGDTDTHTSETHFVKAGGSLQLGALTRVHEIYRAVTHKDMSVLEGSTELSRALKAKPLYNIWIRVALAAMCGGSISLLGFEGSVLDASIAALLGAMLAFLQLRVAAKSAIFSNIFEISIAMLVSFVARGLEQTHLFCYQAIASSGVVLILPGYIILCGSLELASRNIVTGSVKLIYSIIYSLFLGFGIAIGSDFYYLIDQGAKKRRVINSADATFSAQGRFTFHEDLSQHVWQGSFTFLNATSDASASANGQGNVYCHRSPSMPWYQDKVSIWWSFLLVPMFSVGLSLWNLSPIKTRQFPVMIAISCMGWVTNRLANQYIFNRSDVVSFIGSFVVGLLGNLYSRVLKGTAFTAMATGVLFLVPSGIAAVGGLVMTGEDHDESTYSNGLLIGFRMIQVAIGITVGLFFSSFIVYSVGTRSGKGNAVFAF